MKWNILIILGLIVAFIACENTFLKLNGESEPEINRSSQREQPLNNNGVAFYLIQDFDLQSNINFDSITLESEPFIAYNDIVAYDSFAHVFQLRTDASLFFFGERSIDMEAFVMMVDNDTIFHGLLWSPIHSQCYPDVVLTQYIDTEVHYDFIQLIEAYPTSEYATDPVNLNDARIVARLESDGKLKSLVGSPETEPDVETGPFPYPSYIDTMYYWHEIFDDAYIELYGKWKLGSISGGITGGGHDPNFKYLLIYKYGIYQFISGDTLMEFGKVLVDEQTTELLRISLQPDASSSTFFHDSEKYVELTGDDQLNLISPCCDRYNYHFVREK